MPEDRDAIRHSVGQLLLALAANAVDLRRAGMMLYALQIANCTIPRQTAKSQQEADITDEIVDDIVVHPDLGVIAPAAEFEELEEPEEKKSATRRLLDELRAMQAQAELRHKIRQLEARLSVYEPVTPDILDTPVASAAPPASHYRRATVANLQGSAAIAQDSDASLPAPPANRSVTRQYRHPEPNSPKRHHPRRDTQKLRHPERSLARFCTRCSRRTPKSSAPPGPLEPVSHSAGVDANHEMSSAPSTAPLSAAMGGT